VRGVRSANGYIVALLIEDLSVPQQRNILYERRFVLDSEFPKVAEVLADTELWVRTTAATAPSLVQDSQGLTAALGSLPGTTQVLLRGEVPSGTGKLVAVTAWSFDGVNTYRQMYTGK
jgi:hypothetical protein